MNNFFSYIALKNSFLAREYPTGGIPCGGSFKFW